MMDYTKLSLPEVRNELAAIARDTQAAFGGLDARQLNWKPDAARWSVAQCLQHLVTANHLMMVSAQDALASAPRSVWQRLPLLPGLCGRVMIRTQSPGAARKFTAPPQAQPAASAIPRDILDRFVEQHHDALAWTGAIDEAAAARAIMVSPFAKVITYSVLDACRLIVAHDRRHLEQARRVAGEMRTTPAPEI